MRTYLTPLLAVGAAQAAPYGSLNQGQQAPLQPSIVRSAEAIETGVGHFSEWSRATKRDFLVDWQAGRQALWTIVQGNEGGDLDSMTAALTWAYHLEHSTQNTSHPRKAIALLQTEVDALDLRPENSLALANSQMSSGHSDLLTLDELPEIPETLANDIHGIVLVDHAEPLRKWQTAKILSIFDHHQDVGAGKDAEPRIFEKVKSCTTIVAREMLNELEALPEEYHLPHELLELILSAIAIDSKGLKEGTDEDWAVSERILRRSAWRDLSLKKTMKKLGKDLKKAKKDVDHLSVRDLLRRDWKGDLVDTISPRTPSVTLGYSSIPYSLDQQIQKTEFHALFDWFAIEAAWTAQAGTDISVALNKYKNEDGNKIREIVLVVRNDVRIDEDQANSLFETVSKAIESNTELNVTRWHGWDDLGKREAVWTHNNADAGRKVLRPIVEKAVKEWD